MKRSRSVNFEDAIYEDIQKYVASKEQKHYTSVSQFIEKASKKLLDEETMKNKTSKKGK